MGCKLAMYDIRGIQNFIFATNEIKDIIGASELIENIIMRGLNSVVKSHSEWNPNEFIIEWETDKDISFLTDAAVKMQVLFIGGGNAYVLFRNETLCHTVNRELASYILRHSYSLNLAVAVVDKTDDYMNDYDRINGEMRRVKSETPPVKPFGAMPFMKRDAVTGYPLSKEIYLDQKEQISTEVSLKRKCYDDCSGPEKILDNMITQKEENSTLAVVHIDGNSMGTRIKNIMKDQKDYRLAVETMRVISQNIRLGFLEAFNGMCDYMDQVSDAVKEKREGKLYRKIVAAGDDITFICNPKLAFQAVEAFISLVTEKDMYTESGISKEENHGKYGFSACAGIAFFYSHFPFSDAYEVAEACCSIAKAEAKKKEHRNGGDELGFIGCYLDYQICSNINAANLSDYRLKHYGYANGLDSMIFRPYYLSAASYAGIMNLDEKNQDHNIEILWNNLKTFTDFSKTTHMTRSHAKTLRNAFAIGSEKVDEQVTFLKSRDVILPSEDRNSWYDALEFMDFYKKGIRYNEIKN